MDLQTAHMENARGGRFAFDTTLVLFFLAVDFGQSIFSYGIDSVLSFLTLTMLVVLPYFLPFTGEKPSFAGWLFGRTVIGLFGIMLGALFNQALGTVLPDTLRFLPMSFLIASAILSCYVQFYGILRVRLAR